MLLEGTFFLALIPEDETIAFSLQPNQTFEIIEEKTTAHIKTKNFKHITSFSTELLPKFLFIISIDSCKKNHNQTPLLQYPPLPNYRRKANQVSLSPREYRFEKNSDLLIKTQYLKIKKKVKNIRVNTYELDPEIYSQFLKGEPGLIVISQEGFDYVLEEINQARYQTSEPSDIYQFYQTFYLSLKDILDPQDGLERLTQDIKENKYIEKNTKKLKKILDILRVATSKEEHQIVTSLFLHDHDLFLFIYEELFEDSLIPYMSRKELSKILSQLDDLELLEILDYPLAKKKLYENLISRNRMAYLNKLSQTTKKQTNKYPIWDQIKDMYFQKKQSLILLPGESHIVREITDEVCSTNF